MNTENNIRTKLEQQLQPSYLVIVNESRNHNVPPNSETHFNVTIVSDAFSNKRQVQRHQLVYGVLAEELSASVHALALHTFDPQEWQANNEVKQSPPCMGGEK